MSNTSQVQAAKLATALDKLLALYRKETALPEGVHNPITKQAQKVLTEWRQGA